MPRMPIAAIRTFLGTSNHKIQNRMKRRFYMCPIINRNICIPIIFPREKACRKKYAQDAGFTVCIKKSKKFSRKLFKYSKTI